PFLSSCTPYLPDLSSFPTRRSSDLPISMWQFILTQATYLRKITWIFSALLLLPAVIGAFHIGHETLWITSAIVPFLGLLAVAENNRSITYGMSEFELSTRFSLKSVVLARMSIRSEERRVGKECRARVRG